MPDLLPAAAKGGSFRDAALFRPESVVLLGDPTLPETALLARNIGAAGFHGRVFAVGVTAQGLEPVGSVAALPLAPDLGVLSLPPDRVEPAMQALAQRGCFAAILPGAAPGLADWSARTGVRALGQGSFGLAIPALRLNATLSHLAPRPGRLALVGQSAALARSVLDWAEAETVGFSHVIGIGGNANLGFAVALDWLARDSATGAVLLELRRVRDRRAFISAARATARTRPVVAMRAGGRAGDPSGLADAVMEAALRRAGVLMVTGLEDLLAAAQTLARARPRPGGAGAGNRIGIVANGVGLGLLATDAVMAAGLRMAEPSAGPSPAEPPGTPQPGRHRNPIVLAPAAGPALAAAAAKMAADPQVDTVVALHAPAPDAVGDDDAAAAMAAHAKPPGGHGAAPILIAWTGEALAGAQRHRLAGAGHAVFASPEAAVRGALHLARDRSNRAAAAELPPREVLDLRPDRPAVTRILEAVRRSGRQALVEDEALDLLSAYGLAVAPGRRTAPRAEDAADAAAILGFPVALKLLSPDTPRKSEFGGVQLGLYSPAEVRLSAAAMAQRLQARRPQAKVAGFLVQRQVGPRALELRIRLGDDAMFGPWIGFGQGGTAADLASDEAHDLPPLNLALAQALIDRARVSRLIDGFRDFPPANRAAIADALVRIAQLAVDFPEIAALTVNPLFADPHGVRAVDAKVALRPTDAPPSPLAVPPYPAELALRHRLRNGEELLVRPIRPEDAEAHGAFFRRLPAEDIRFRFFSPLKELSPAMAARLTQIDYGREMAFVAMRDAPPGPDQMLGVARVIRAVGAETAAEFAVIVDPEMKGQGLARHLMHRLFDWARSEGIRRIVGHVLAENAPMIGFVESLGFRVHRSRDDAEVLEAVYEVTDTAA